MWHGPAPSKAAPDNADVKSLSYIKNSIVTVHLFGEIIYADIFGETHVTEFCNFYDPSTDDFAFCSEGNSAN
jgi:hypothetical protein